MEKIISNKAASFASMELARFALERADQRASSILEQYRKSQQTATIRWQASL